MSPAEDRPRRTGGGGGFRGGPLDQAFQIYAPSAIYSIGLGALTPSMAPAATAFGASVALAAASVVLVGLGSLAANAPAAWLASRAGERTAIIVSAWTGTLGALMALAAVAGWFPVPDHIGLGILMAGLAVVGMAGAGFNLARMSYLAVAIPGSHRARAMSTLGGTIRLGLFAGPFIGAGLQSLLGLQGGFVAATGAMALAGVLSFAIRDLEVPSTTASPGAPGTPTSTTPAQLTDTSTPPADRSAIPSDPPMVPDASDPPTDPPTDGSATPSASQARPTFRSLARVYRRVLLTSGIGVVCLSAARASRSAVIPLWATEMGLSPAAASAIYGLAGLADLLMFYPSGLLMDRRGRRVVAVTCMSGLALSIALVPLTGSPWWFAGAALLVGLGNGFGSGIVMTLGADYAPPVGRPQFLALWRLHSDAGMLTGPAVLSAVTGLAGLAAGVWAVAAIAALGALIFARALPHGPGAVTGRPSG